MASGHRRRLTRSTFQGYGSRTAISQRGEERRGHSGRCCVGSSASIRIPQPSSASIPHPRPCVPACARPRHRLTERDETRRCPAPLWAGGAPRCPHPKSQRGAAPRRPTARGGGAGSAGGARGRTHTHTHSHTHTRVPVRTHGRTHTRTCVRTGARAYIRACVHSRNYMRAGCMHVRVHTYIRGYEYMLYLGTRICTDTDTDTHASTEAGVRAHPSLHTHDGRITPAQGYPHMHLHRRRHVRTHSPALPHVCTARSAAPFRPAAALLTRSAERSISSRLRAGESLAMFPPPPPARRPRHHRAGSGGRRGASAI